MTRDNLAVWHDHGCPCGPCACARADVRRMEAERAAVAAASRHDVAAKTGASK